MTAVLTLGLYVALTALILVASEAYLLRQRLARAEAECARLQTRPSSITVTVGASLPPSIATRDGWTLSELEGGL